MKHKIFIAIAAIGLLSISSYAQDSGIDPKDLFGDIRARHIGPAVMSGRINDLESHPTNPRIIYAGSAGGGVWKSNDAGATSEKPMIMKRKLMDSLISLMIFLRPMINGESFL